VSLAAGCGFSSTDRPVLDGGSGGFPGDGKPIIDAPSGSATCFGLGVWELCTAGVPGTKTLSGAIDTDTSPLCQASSVVQWTALQPDACFVIADTVTIAGLKATGSRPLVIIGTRGVTVAGLLDVASRRSGRGPGSQSTECQPFGRTPGLGGAPPAAGGGGGGAGGSFTSRGGNGGNGDQGFHQNGQAADLDLGLPMRLRGGCAGQAGGSGDSATSGGDAGPGGGAVYLVSGGKLAIMGTINASGGGGAGGGARNGGGGGGSGGMIILQGSPITTTAASVILAAGGGGGGGGDPLTAPGADGSDPVAASPIAVASGGAGGVLALGSGGHGGKGFPAPASEPDASGGDTDAGGGGGGGAAGSIQANQGLGDAQVSPAVMVR